MVRVFSTLLSLSLAVCGAIAGIDLTPKVAEIKSEGIVLRQVTFATDDGMATYVPPFGWNIRGGKDRVQLTPPSKTFAEASITSEPLQKIQPFDEPVVEALEQQVIAEVGAAAESVQVLSREENAAPMPQKQSYR